MTFFIRCACGEDEDEVFRKGGCGDNIDAEVDDGDDDDDDGSSSSSSSSSEDEAGVGCKRGVGDRGTQGRQLQGPLEALEQGGGSSSSSSSSSERGAEASGGGNDFSDLFESDDE